MLTDTGLALAEGPPTATGDIGGNPMVFVKVSETYDLSTNVGKMGIVGIHTPKGDLISRLWGGLAMQHKYVRFHSCDVAMACASLLPADPLQIGQEAGSIAPQDMFNPILYKAVSNDSMSNLQAFLSANATVDSQIGTAKGSVVDLNDSDFQFNDSVSISQFDMYYSLLGNPDGFKKAMPQSGLEMRGLYPLVYQVVSNYGVNTAGMTESVSIGNNSNSANPIYGPDSRDGSSPLLISNVQLRGPAMRMPRVNTTYLPYNSTQNAPLSGKANLNFGDTTRGMPPCYVALIILPPATLNKLYYRLKVTWTIEFTELRSLDEISNWRGLSEIGVLAYATDYASQSEALMSEMESMVDVGNANIQKIMEGR